MTQHHIPTGNSIYIRSEKNAVEYERQSTNTQVSSNDEVQNKKKSYLHNIIAFFKILLQRIRNTLNKTAKSDKYVRLCCNIVKILRLKNAQEKKKYSKLYRQMLVLRQVFRWDGLYQTVQQFCQSGSEMFSKKQLGMTLFKFFMLFGDMLDRIIFLLQILDKKEYQSFLSKIQKVESDCYFIECLIWLFYNSVTLKGQQGKKRNIKKAKIVKYIIDCFTSHNKFSKRIFELDPKYTAYLGIISSVIGLYTILI